MAGVALLSLLLLWLIRWSLVTCITTALYVLLDEMALHRRFQVMCNADKAR